MSAGGASEPFDYLLKVRTQAAGVTLNTLHCLHTHQNALYPQVLFELLTDMLCKSRFCWWATRVWASPRC